MNRQQFNLSEEDLDLLGRIMAAEAGALGPDAMRAVGATVLNRAVLGNFGGNTIKGVLEEGGQFEPVMKAGGLASELPHLEGPLKESVDAILNELREGTFKDPTKDTTGGSLYFLNEDLSNQRGTNFLSDKPRDNFVTYGEGAIQHTHAGGAPVPDYDVVVAGAAPQEPAPGGFLSAFGLTAPGPQPRPRLSPFNAGDPLRNPEMKAMLAQRLKALQEQQRDEERRASMARLSNLFNRGGSSSSPYGSASGFGAGLAAGFSKPPGRSV